jgi:DegV family protein with EDD domain
MSVAVVVDSSAGISKEVAEKYGVRVVPLHVMWDKKSYVDGVELTLEDFYARLETSNTLPTTDSSVQGEFLDMFEELKGKVDGIVAIVLSPEVPAAAYRSALAAREMVEGLPVEVIDSRTCLTGLALIATGAAQAAMTGAKMDEVVNVANNIISKVTTFSSLGSFSYSARLGRLGSSKEAEKEGDEEKRIFTIGAGFKPFEKRPTLAEARKRLVELVKEGARKDTPLHLAVMHTSARDAAEELRDEIAAEYNCAEMWISEATPVIACHFGPGTITVSFYNE